MSTKTRTITVNHCIQCEGDKMLEVRKHASEAFDVMNLLSQSYQGKHKYGTTIVQFVRALIAAEQDQRRLVAMIRRDAERRLKEVDALIAALRFVSDSTHETYSSGISFGGKAMSIQLTETFRVAIDRLGMLVAGDKGLVEGRQPHNEKDFMAEIMQEEERKATQ